MEVKAIAQLIKLRDYITRYEWDVYRYSSQYIRFKQKHWNDIYHYWEHKTEGAQESVSESEFQSSLNRHFLNESDSQQAIKLPTTEESLRQYFLDELFPLQLKWATSTVTDISFYDEHYTRDARIKYFLQRFPDIYLLMYDPVFKVKNLFVDGEIILISPFGIDIIYWLESVSDHIYRAHNHRKWYVETPEQREVIISPLNHLNRTKQIVRSILKTHQVAIPIKKIVLAKNNQIIFSSEPYQTKYVGSVQYDQWFHEKRQVHSTLKSKQLKAAAALLKHCLSTYVKRPEWVGE